MDSFLSPGDLVYRGSVTRQNGPELIALPNVDGLFVGRAAWTPQGFFEIVKIVNDAAKKKETR
jgi:triosephosphate isomerase